MQHEWRDANGTVQRASPRTVDRLRQVIGTAPDDLERRAPLVTRPGRDLGLGRVRVTCEDGTELVVDGRLPDDFPLGYHRLHVDDAPPRLLVVSPGRCWLPEGRAWGWAVQLYGVRSRSSWGIGDLRDLEALRTWTEQQGGGFLIVNPVHAVAPTVPVEASPYLPATRRFRNPIYLHVPHVPGYDPADVDTDALRRVVRTELVERDEVWIVKRAALRRAHDRHLSTGDTEDFDRWRSEHGAGLEDFATWCVLTEHHGPDWRRWPTALRRPDADGVAAFREAHADEIGFHAWLQWQLDEQLRRATGGLTVVQDLPIGVSGAGADAWAWQETLAQGVTVGAPPDALNSLGQDWGSPPLVPWRLRLAEYEPFIQSVRSTISGAGGLRIDHVMGLFRLWWIAEGSDATEGAYVRYPSDDLLDIVALESHRARAVIVGEDLGTVEPEVPEALASRSILSYKLLWFEEAHPVAWPSAALGTVTSHDLPTVAGLWTGSDAADQLATTGMPEEDVRQGREELLGKLTRAGLEADATPAAAVDAAYRQLCRAPCLLLALSLEDAVLEERRPNMPGTVERDNWRLPLPLPVDDLDRSTTAARLVALANAGLGADDQPD